MGKIAVDVVLLPPEEIMEKAIEISRKLAAGFEHPYKIILNKKNCLPHISLLQCAIDENNLPEIENILRNVAQASKPLELTVAGIASNEEFQTPYLKIEKTPQLQKLHEAVVKKLSKVYSSDVVESMVYGGKMNLLSLSYVKNFLKIGGFEKFSPHITLGRGKVEQNTAPFNFTISRLALCHLGESNTCVKILFETNLQKR